MEINKKMDIQVASLKTVLESLKLETVRYLAGKHNTRVQFNPAVMISTAEHWRSTGAVAISKV